MKYRVQAAVGGTAIVALLAAACDDTGGEPEAPAGAPSPDETEDDSAATSDDGDAPAEALDDEAADEPQQQPQPVVEDVADGFDQPWGLAFVDDGPLLLVTERTGTLSLVDTATGEVTDIAGVPDVTADGQGGLLDVEVDGDRVYLTYVAADDDGATSTYLAGARLDLDTAELADLEVLFTVDPALPTPAAHFGSRVVVGPDGHLYVTVGDRNNKQFDDHPSQDPSTHHGTTIRLATDGTVPDDNPFVDDPDVRDEIFSLGHRNAQGMTVHPDTGEIWQSEHGEEDGDELNVLQAGGNFGWPLATTACEYGTDSPIGVHPDERDDLVAPVLTWECGTGGFAPGGMAFYDGDMFLAWQGDLFVGGLATEDLARFTVDGTDVEEAERLLGDEGWRIRDVAVGPHDGAIYLALDDADVPLVRLVPGGED